MVTDKELEMGSFYHLCELKRGKIPDNISFAFSFGGTHSARKYIDLWTMDTNLFGTAEENPWAQVMTIEYFLKKFDVVGKESHTEFERFYGEV